MSHLARKGFCLVQNNASVTELWVELKVMHLSICYQERKTKTFSVYTILLFRKLKLSRCEASL